ncbi:MAG: Dam family site-specific DNA-(adenine-N6)-methyltransferase [Vicinamibacterales bacterium]
MLRPPLKWAGGKRWQLPLLEPVWAQHRERRLVEPFCGGLGVALGLSPDRALLNDVNSHVINFYRWVSRGLCADLPMKNDRATYDSYRRRFNTLLQEGRGRRREAALLFYYLNRTGYNGLCRFNRSGAFNVPFGRYARIRYEEDFLRYRVRFANWTFTAVDVERVRYEPDDFIYADPPYDVNFTQYSSGGFDWDDQVRTARRLARHPGPVVLVNQATSRIEALYREHGYDLVFLDGPRRISCTGDRRPARELLATRNLEVPRP